MAAHDADHSSAGPRARVVVGVDGSEPSLSALDRAALEAQRRGADLHIVCSWAYPISVGYVYVPTGMIRDQAETVATEAVARAQSLAPGIAVHPDVTERSALLALVDASEGADLLVVGSRGRGAFTETLVGSVSRYCAHHAHCPVIVVRPSAGELPGAGAAGRRRIVVGVDGSTHADAALAWASGEAARSDSSLHVVSAWRRSRVFANPAELQEAATRIVDAAVTRVATLAPGVEVDGEAPEGFPALALIDASAGADLLVLGSRGLGGVKGLLLGSVGQTCLHHAPCAVALVRPGPPPRTGGDGAPALQEIGEDECFALLASEDVGRLAVVHDGRPEIFPVNYTLVGRTIVIRTAPGTKLQSASLAHVAFEVEQLDREARRGWVVEVKGVAEDVSDGIDAWSKEALASPARTWITGDHSHVIAISRPAVSGRRLVGA